MDLSRIQEAIDKNPTGLIVIPGKKEIQAMFWTDKEQTEQVLIENFIGGICHNAVQTKRTTKAALLQYLLKLLK